MALIFKSCVTKLLSRPRCTGSMFTLVSLAVADPGFTVGGRRPRRGAADSRSGYVSKILYVETKESGHIVGRAPGTFLLDPPMLGSYCVLHVINFISTVLTGWKIKCQWKLTSQVCCLYRALVKTFKGNLVSQQKVFSKAWFGTLTVCQAAKLLWFSLGFRYRMWCA